MDLLWLWLMYLWVVDESIDLDDVSKTRVVVDQQERRIVDVRVISVSFS